MMRLVGPHRVHLWWVAAVCVAFAAFWRAAVGAPMMSSVLYAAGFTAAMALMASWGLGRCGFARSLDILDADGIGSGHEQRTH